MVPWQLKSISGVRIWNSEEPRHNLIPLHLSSLNSYHKTCPPCCLWSLKASPELPCTYFLVLCLYSSPSPLSLICQNPPHLSGPSANIIWQSPSSHRRPPLPTGGILFNFTPSVFRKCLCPSLNGTLTPVLLTQLA